MATYTSSVWDRLIAPVPASAAGRRTLQLTLPQYKRAIARDLESLLNTRVAISQEELAIYPACRESIVNFGLADFAQLFRIGTPPYRWHSRSLRPRFDELRRRT